jgi:hypothetical protein
METRKYRIAAGIYLICIGLVYGTVSGPVELLPVIADALENNLEKIRTWRGSAEYESYHFVDLGKDNYSNIVIDYEESSKITFYVNQDKNFIRNSSVTVLTAKQHNLESLSFVSRAESVLDKDKIYLVFFPFQEDPNTSEPRRLMIMNHEEDAIVKQWMGSLVFNPRGILQQMISVLPQRFRSTYRSISEGTYQPSFGEVAVSREGDLITVYLALKDVNGTFGLIEEWYVFDTSIGFNMVSCKMTNALQKETWQVSYELFKDVYLPTAITYFREDHANGKKIFKSNITIKTEMLNEPAEESELIISPGKMGLRKGDYIVDHTKGGLRYPWDPDTSDLK